MSFVFANSIARLSDPSGVCKDDPKMLPYLQEKISATLTRLYKLPINGGNPFLFALSGPKPHQITKDIPTAATNGKMYLWNPEFLMRLSADETATVMSHESYHVLFHHCSPERSQGRSRGEWNIAIDFVVNGVIEAEHDLSGRRNAQPLIWTGPLGPPVTLSDYLAWLDGTIQSIPEGCFADPSVHGRSPESIYDEIMQHSINSPRACKPGNISGGGSGSGCGSMTIDPNTKMSAIPGPWKEGLCPSCGATGSGSGGPGTLDSHIPPEQTKDEVMGDMMRAAEQTAVIGRGTVPNSVTEALGLLKKPELSPRDIIKSAIANKQIDVGNMNDWKRIRRRPTFIYTKNAEGKFVPKHRMFIPKKYEFRPKWVALMDTSGSMSNSDIANGVKELKLVADIAEGWIVPCDATPKWDEATKVKNTTDIMRTRIVGRGGTVFEQFFEELHKQECGQNVDLVIIITDGDCDQIPVKLAPKGADVLWIITNNREFKPNFGRVCKLKSSRT